jgi:hypothetical protein
MKNFIEKGRKRITDKYFLHHHHQWWTEYENAIDALNLLSSIAEKESDELFLNSQHVHGL